MAPPPPANLPLQQRLLHLAQTLQFGWFCGHVALLLCTLRYSLSYITFNYYSRWAQFSYRTAFIAASITYGIVVFKGYRARQKAGKPANAMSLLADENFQYLGIALIWLSTPQIGLAIAPFAVYSIFHIATYSRSILLPTLQPGQQQQPTSGTQKPSSALADAIGRFSKDYYDVSMTLVALLEIFIWLRLLGGALIFRRGAFFLLIIYTAFLRARIAQSTFVQAAMEQLRDRGDRLVNQPNSNAQLKQAWDAVKRILKQAHDMTDFSRYLQGGAQKAPAKKEQ